MQKRKLNWSVDELMQSRDRRREWYRRHRESNRLKRVEAKLIVLSHYGPNGKLQCCWPDCDVTDPDILELDHIENNGEEDRKIRGEGASMYRSLIRENFPSGYQTLCCNHNRKKRMMRISEERSYGQHSKRP